MLQETMQTNYFRKLDFLLKNVQGVVFFIDSDGIFRISEGKGLAKIGLKPGEVVGLSVFEFYRDFPEITTAIRSALQGKKITKHISLGEARFDVVFSPYSETDETVTGVIGLATDITEKELSEKKLAKSEESYKMIVDLAPDGFLRGNSKGEIIYCNEKALEITGYSKDNLLGKNIATLFSTKSLNRFPLRYDLLEQGEAVISERILKRADGKEILVQSNSKKMPDGTYVAFFRDISIIKKMEDAMERAARLESLGFLAGGIAHNFNNMMSGIFGYIMVAEKKTNEDFTRDTLQYILTLIDRVRKLTGQLITFSKGGRPLKEVCVIEELINELCTFCLSGKPIVLVNNIHTETYCDIDKNQISQVIENILINSIQAMPEKGTVTVDSELLHMKEENKYMLKSGDYLKISISDTGDGIDPEHMSKIFDPFFTTKKTGHGLGLAISYSIIKQHGGVIEYLSEKSKGTTCHIILPARTDQDIPEE